MAIRERTAEDPPIADRNELIEKLEAMRRALYHLYSEVQYMPLDKDIDEQYKVNRCLIRIEDIEAVKKTAEELWDKVEAIRESFKWTVYAPDDRRGIWTPGS